MFKKLAHAVLATALGASMLMMPSEASAITIPAPEGTGMTSFSQQDNLMQNVRFERRRWLLGRNGHYWGRSRDGYWRRGFGSPRSRYYNRRYGRGWYGYPRYRYGGYGYPWRYRYYDRWDNDNAWLLGIPFAFAAGAALASPGYYGGSRYYGGYRGSAHVRWCSSRYRSYNPRTNTWVGYSGRVYQCDSPYDRR
jgi:BA14K-like protein